MTTTTPNAQTALINDNASPTKGALELVDVGKFYDPRKPADRAVDNFNLSVEPGQFITLLGPSGCGKTTTLRMIAGFETPSEGDILVDGKSILSLAPSRRPMSMVFQSYALFPHLSIIDNVGFGLTARHASKSERAARVGQVMGLMGIEEYAERYPHQLSGGQQQRVALARAVVMEPSILLFDEPLSNLDARLRMRMREEIRSIQQRLGITSVFVTHDQSEALTMSDLIVVMRAGLIEQIGRPEEIYHRPANTFVAEFLGTANFMDTEVLDITETHGTDKRATIKVAANQTQVPCAPHLNKGDSARVLVRSEDLHVGTPTPGSANSLPGRVEFTAFDGAITRYTVQTALGTMHGEAEGSEQPLAPGTEVSCSFEPSNLWVISA